MLEDEDKLMLGVIDVLGDSVVDGEMLLVCEILGDKDGVVLDVFDADTLVLGVSETLEVDDRLGVIDKLADIDAEVVMLGVLRFWRHSP